MYESHIASTCENDMHFDIRIDLGKCNFESASLNIAHDGIITVTLYSFFWKGELVKATFDNGFEWNWNFKAN